MSNLNSLDNVLVDVIEYVTGQMLNNAGYDRTIQAKILKCNNEATGEYIVQHQGSNFYAYASNPETNYSSNSNVYILVPSNDMTQHKTIIGVVKNEGLNYSPIIPNALRYLTYGKNVIELKKTISLCSYLSYQGSESVSYTLVQNASETTNPAKNFWYEKKTISDEEELTYILTEDTKYDKTKKYYEQKVEKKYEDGVNIIELYNEEKSSNYHANDELKDVYIETDLIKIDIAGIKQYISENNSVDSLKVGGTFKTSLKEEQQLQGNYGLYLKLELKQNDETIIKDIVIGVSSMTGNPYKYFSPSEQLSYFDISGYSFSKIIKIAFFAENFPIVDKNKILEDDKDLFLKNITLQGCELLDTDTLKGTFLRVLTPKGTIFYPNVADTTTLPLKAEVWDSGTVVATAAEDLGYYWFKENCSVIQTSTTQYHSLGDVGWACLNSHDSNYNFIPASDTYNLKIQDNIWYDQKYKCVAAYRSQSLSKEINVINLNAQYRIVLATKSNISVYPKNRAGQETITCKIEHRSNYNSDWVDITDSTQTGYKIVIKWFVKDSWGNYKQSLNVAPDNLSLKINLSDFSKELKIGVYVKVTQNNETVEGSKFINLLKADSTTERYVLEIINDNGVFMYDELGLSPTCEANIHPQTIKPLRYKIIDTVAGEEIAGEEVPASKALWSFPLPQESLLISPTDAETNETVLQITGSSVSFTIADQFDDSKRKNVVQLNVDYNGFELYASTEILCITQGDRGTNGTAYSIKIIPRVIDGVNQTEQLWFDSYFPIVRFKYINNEDNVGLKPLQQYIDYPIWFNVAVYYENNKIFESNCSGPPSLLDETNVETDTIDVKWKIKKGYNTYSLYKVDANSGLFSFTELKPDPFNFLEPYKNQHFSHLLEVTVTYKGNQLIDVMPIGTVVQYVTEIDNGKEIADKTDIYIKENTGFKSVKYQDDGTLPGTKNAEKEFKLYEYWSGKNKDEQNQYNIDITQDFDWETVGWISVKKQNDKGTGENIWVNSQDWGTPNNGVFRPAASSNCECLTNAVVATSNMDLVEIGEEQYPAIQLHLPIDFYINRYAHKFLNGWDGNSVNINEEEGYILAPQIGAGKKEEDNTFTGIVMGVSKTHAEEATSQQTGIFAYAHTQQTFFLDAETGGAIFGPRGIGSISVIPEVRSDGVVKTNPVIQSGGYYLQHTDSDTGGNGLSIGFGYYPYIQYGSKKFQVDSDGIMTASGATIKGRFEASNAANSADRSEIVIGENTDEVNRKSSHITLYGYEAVTNGDNKKLYETFKTYISPQTFEISYTPIKNYRNFYSPDENGRVPEQSNKRLADLVNAPRESYLEFNNQTGSLELKGSFKSESEGASVQFGQSGKSFIRFVDYKEKIAEDTLSDSISDYQKDINELAKEVAENENFQDESAKTNTVEKGIEILNNWITKENSLITAMELYQSTDSEKSMGLKNLIDSFNLLTIDDNSIRVDNIPAVERKIQNLENNIAKCNKNIEDYGLQYHNNAITEATYQEQIHEENLNIAFYEGQLNGNPKEAIETQEETNYYGTELPSDGYRGVLKRLYAKKDSIIENIKKVLKKLNIEITTLNETDDVKEIGQKFTIIDDFYFDMSEAKTDYEINKVKLQYLTEYKSYLTSITNVQNQLDTKFYDFNPETGTYERKKVYTNMKGEMYLSHDEFYIKGYGEEGSEVNSTPESSLIYKDGTLTLVGDLEVTALPYSRFVMKRSGIGNQLFFGTEDGKTSLQLASGVFALSMNSGSSFVGIRGGDFSLDNVSFNLVTPSADVHIGKKHSSICFRGYDDDNNLESQIQMTSSVFDVMGKKSHLYLHPKTGKLSYTGDINIATANGVFRMSDSSMLLRFGSITSPNSDEKDYFKIKTDFRLTPTSFGIHLYSNEKLELVNANEQSNSEPSTELDFFGGNYTDEEFSKYFQHDLLPEDGLDDDQKNIYNSLFNSDNINKADKENDNEDFKVQKTSGDPAEAENQQKIEQPEYYFDEEEQQWKENGNVTTIDLSNDNNITIPNYLSTTGDANKETWNEISGISYSAKSGKLRFNGDFTLKNNSGSIVFTDGLMRIMFRTYYTNEEGEIQYDKPKTRMCISQNSFYFYGFGYTRSREEAQEMAYEHGFTVAYPASEILETNTQSSCKVISGIVWRDGTLTIMGEIRAKKGQIGGWSINDQMLVSASGNAIIDGATGRTNLFGGGFDGNSINNNTTPGAIISDYANRRAALTCGEFSVSGTPDIDILQAIYTANILPEIKKKATALMKSFADIDIEKLNANFSHSDTVPNPKGVFIGVKPTTAGSGQTARYNEEEQKFEYRGNINA